MDKKTAGQVHFEHENSGYGLFWHEQDADTKARHERIAAAVITHVRPQIERAERKRIIIEIDTVKAEARAAAMNYAETIISELVIPFDLFSSEIFWNHDADGVLYAAANCNDLFFWATSDLEKIALSDIPDIKTAITDSPDNGLILWCCRKRKMRPQTPYYGHLKGEEHLFDACGDERNSYVIAGRKV